jgi:hypothetical protein
VPFLSPVTVMVLAEAAASTETLPGEDVTV